MSVNTKMTAIADKIRGLLGLTGTMGLDAMATHLGTEQANITAALTALSDKGVDVPSGANSDNLAELIAAIEAGGGALNLISGSFTPAEDTITATIKHGLGKVPSIAFFAPKDFRKELPKAGSDSASKWLLSAVYLNGLSLAAYSYWGSQITTVRTTVKTDSDITTTSIFCYIQGATDSTFSYSGANSTAQLLAGQEYLWVAG